MNSENPTIKFTSPIEQDPSYTDPVEIEKARQELLALDKDGKLFIAPNQMFKGELEVLKDQLFEPRAELGGQSAYDYFDKIIFGHGEGPTDIDQRTFKGMGSLDEQYQGTIGEIKSRIAPKAQKILTAVCGTNSEDKTTLTKAIAEYLSKQKAET